jgi:hypothetical protein
MASKKPFRKRYRGREEQKAMFAKLNKKQAKAAIDLLRFTGRRNLQQAALQLLDQYSPNRQGMRPSISIPKALAEKGWKFVGAGVAKSTIAHPKSGIAIKVAHDLDDMDEEFLAARKLAKRKVKIREGGRVYTLRVPKLYKDYASGKTMVVEYIPHVERYMDRDRAPAHLAHKARRRFRIGDLHENNIVQVDRGQGQTFALLDLGAPDDMIPFHTASANRSTRRRRRRRGKKKT